MIVAATSRPHRRRNRRQWLNQTTAIELRRVGDGLGVGLPERMTFSGNSCREVLLT
jgi:hypothetical protein